MKTISATIHKIWLESGQIAADLVCNQTMITAPGQYLALTPMELGQPRITDLFCDQPYGKAYPGCTNSISLAAW